jgi:hypothetical protein
MISQQLILKVLRKLGAFLRQLSYIETNFRNAIFSHFGPIYHSHSRTTNKAE